MTAVDFLLSKTAKHCFNQQDIEEAKQMEKQQIIEGITFFKDRPYEEITAEQYYNETFNR